MAVRNGLNDDHDLQDDNALFEEENFVQLDSDIPPHLRALAAAAELGHLDSFRQALDGLEGSIDQPVEDGDTALHLTCLYGHFHCVELLLDRGANLEVMDEDGGIPLHDAAAGGYPEIVQLILCRASPDCVKRMLDSVDVEGDTPLHHAARGEHVDVIRSLLASGASLTKANLYGKIPSELPDPDTEAKRILEAAVSTAQCQ